MSSIFAGFITFFLLISQGNPPGLQRTDRGISGEVKAYREKCFYPKKLKDEIIPGEAFRGEYQIAVLFDLKGRVLAEKTFTEAGEVEFREGMRWDQEGKLSEIRRLNPEGELLEHTKFKYSDNGRLVEKLNLDSIGKTIGWNTYAFDLEGRKVRESNYDVNGQQKSSLETRYGKETGVYEQYTYSTENALKEKSKCFLGSNGKLKERVILDHRGWTVEKIEYHYDTHNRLSRLKKYDEGGDLKYKWVKSYDAFGNLIELKTYIKGIYLSSEKQFEYKYDDSGNWTQKIEFKNKIPVKVTIRNFFYF